jgi:hypothetical protein
VVHTLSTNWTEAAMERFYQAEVEHGDSRSHLASLYRAYG